MALNTKSKPSRHTSYLFIAQDDYHVQQWQFSRRTLVSALGLTIILVAAALFFSADFLTRLIYHNKINEIRKHYVALTETVSALQTRLDEMNTQVGDLEERDKALRTYSNLPAIDQDVRQLGVGGVHLRKSTSMEDLTPLVESRLSDIEMNVNQLARKVRLELASYSTIYDKVKLDREKLAAIPSLSPVEGGYMNSGFGYRRDPFTQKVRFHYGQDISATTGTSVFAPADGMVVETRYRGGYGKVIKIKHGYGYVTYFAHLSEFSVSKGQKINRGDLIGKIGNTGRSTAPHLHYEVHYFNSPQNPLDYFFSGYLE